MWKAPIIGYLKFETVGGKAVTVHLNWMVKVTTAGAGAWIDVGVRGTNVTVIGWLPRSV